MVVLSVLTFPTDMRIEEQGWWRNFFKHCFQHGKISFVNEQQLPMMQTTALRVRVLWLRQTNSQVLKKSCGEKRTPWPLSEWERAPTPAWTGLYCFSGHITLRMVLIYYTQVHFRWLSFTENKGEDVANYIKEKGYLQTQREKWLNWLHWSLRGLA